MHGRIAVELVYVLQPTSLNNRFDVIEVYEGFCLYLEYEGAES